jgi:hypothetical protein
MSVYRQAAKTLTEAEVRALKRNAKQLIRNYEGEDLAEAYAKVLLARKAANLPGADRMLVPSTDMWIMAMALNARLTEESGRAGFTMHTVHGPVRMEEFVEPPEDDGR